MRWDFVDPGSRREVQQRAAVLEAIDRWWTEFSARAKSLGDHFSGRGDLDVPGWMNRHLQAVHSKLMWEFGPAVQGPGHRLVITPEAEHDLRPLVRSVLEAAPRLEDWEFYGYRLPVPPMEAAVLVEARAGVDISGMQVRASVGANHRIDLVFGLERLQEEALLTQAAFVCAENLLGEEVLDHWVGSIEGVRETGEGRWLPFDRLRSRVEALIGSIQDQLPDSPWHERVETAEWSMFRIQPPEQEDYPAQEDLFVGKSPHTEMWMAARRDPLFSSRRFSRAGETFCYLKLDGSEGFGEGGFGGKDEVEDAVDEALRPDGLGCQIGGGTGLRYSYVDMAVLDVPAALDRIRPILRKGKLPRRSWVLFFDHDMSGEWVGIWDESPPPPGFVEA